MSRDANMSRDARHIRLVAGKLICFSRASTPALVRCSTFLQSRSLLPPAHLCGATPFVKLVKHVRSCVNTAAPE